MGRDGRRNCSNCRHRDLPCDLELGDRSYHSLVCLTMSQHKCVGFTLFGHQRFFLRQKILQCSEFSTDGFALAHGAAQPLMKKVRQFHGSLSPFEEFAMDAPSATSAVHRPGRGRVFDRSSMRSAIRRSSGCANCRSSTGPRDHSGQAGIFQPGGEREGPHRRGHGRSRWRRRASSTPTPC